MKSYGWSFGKWRERYSWLFQITPRQSESALPLIGRRHWVCNGDWMNICEKQVSP